MTVVPVVLEHVRPGARGLARNLGEVRVFEFLGDRSHSMCGNSTSILGRHLVPDEVEVVGKRVRLGGLARLGGKYNCRMVEGLPSLGNRSGIDEVLFPPDGVSPTIEVALDDFEVVFAIGEQDPVFSRSELPDCVKRIAEFCSMAEVTTVSVTKGCRRPEGFVNDVLDPKEFTVGEFRGRTGDAEDDWTGDCQRFKVEVDPSTCLIECDRLQVVGKALCIGVRCLVVMCC